MRTSSILMITLLLGACGGDDGGGTDAGTVTDGRIGDGRIGDGPTGIDAASNAQVDLTFGGACMPGFDGPLVVASNADSVAIASTGIVHYSIQFALEVSSGTIVLSTAERVANGTVINLISMQTTWTNISNDAVDPIAGTITVRDYQEQAGILDLTLTGVVLQNPSNDSLCEIDGTIVTTGTSF